MFRAEQRADGDRQRRRAPWLHAVTIRQAAGPHRKRPKPAEIVKSEHESGRNERELAKIGTFLYILGQYGKECHPAAGLFPAKSGGNDGQRHHWHHLNTTRTATLGEVYKPEGQSLFSLLRNSPPSPHVPFPGLLSALLKQVIGKLGVGGVVLKPERKNETVKRSRPKK
nr:MAG TPA: hypothetical protein [Caudoviricetes sp.]